MSYSLLLKLHPKQSFKQTQRLIMSSQMQQAIQFLQLPLQELEILIEEELQRNPLLESEVEDEISQASEDERDLAEEEVATGAEEEAQLEFETEDFRVLKLLDEEFRDHFAESGNFQPTANQNQESLHNFIESSIPEEASLFEFLMQQAEEVFDSQTDKHMAELIIGNLDASGYLSVSLHEIAKMNNFAEEDLEAVLQIIQSFEPYGIAARNTRESFLIQLKCLNKANTLAYRIIHDHYDCFLHHHLRSLQKKLTCSQTELSEALYGVLAKLQLHPGKSRSLEHSPLIIPDISIVSDEEQYRIVVHDENVPALRLNRRYLKLLDEQDLPRETFEFIKNKLNSAKWLMRSLYQRNETLYRLAEALLKFQKRFLTEPNGNLEPLNMKILADELQLHESTIARAVANKYIHTPRGLLPLRFFFSHAYITEDGEDVSSRTVKEEIRRCISNEEKSRPLSDEQITLELKKLGIQCARRTVAKYRLQLGLGNAHQRRRFNGDN